MSPREDSAEYHISKNSYPLHDIEAQTQNLPLPQDARKGTAKGKENRAGTKKDTEEGRDKPTSQSAAAKETRKTYFGNMPLVMQAQTKGATSL
jgi:hypothetical protein